MKKLMATFALVCAVLTGCASYDTSEYQSTQERFFALDYMFGETLIVVDRETGVMYLVYEYNRGAGITIMVDADGKPLIWEGEQ